MSFRRLKNVFSRQDNSKTKVRCLEDVLCWLGRSRSIMQEISIVSITTLVLQDKPQGCILSNFYKPLRALSLPRMLAEFFLTCIFHYSWEIFHIYDLHIPRKCIESKNIYLSPPPKSKLSPKFLSSPPGRVKLLISPSQCFFENLFPQQQKRVQEPMICFIKIQSGNMKMTWNIRLFIFCMTYNFSNVMAVQFFK